MNFTYQKLLKKHGVRKFHWRKNDNFDILCVFGDCCRVNASSIFEIILAAFRFKRTRKLSGSLTQQQSIEAISASSRFI